MVADWKDCHLGDVITLQRGFDLPIQNRKIGNVPVVSSSGITGVHSEAKVSGPGVVTGRYGTIGQVFYIKQDFWPLNTTLYVKDFKGNDPHFISYLLRTINFESHNDKSSVPGVNRNHLHMVKVMIPPISEQRTISDILGTLDDKIELNRQMNETLNVIAKAIFTSWFIDFDPVKAKMEGLKPYGMDTETAALFPDSFEDSAWGKIPKVWDIQPLDQVADFLNGLALQKYPPEDMDYLPVIKIAELRRGTSETSDKASPNIEKKYIVEDGDVLFSWSGSLEVVIWCGGKGALNQHLFKVTSLKYPKWFYYQWIKYHLPEFQAIAAGKATTMGHIQRHHLSAAYTIVPSEKTLNRIDQIMAPILDLIINNEKESHTLATIRDTLLPKLLSGEIRVNDAEKYAEALL